MFCAQVVRDWAPREADRFYNLLKDGFFNNQRIYRVTPKYIQFGYHADEAVNEDVYKYVGVYILGRKISEGMHKCESVYVFVRRTTRVAVYK